MRPSIPPEYACHDQITSQPSLKWIYALWPFSPMLRMEEAQFFWMFQTRLALLCSRWWSSRWKVRLWLVNRLQMDGRTQRPAPLQTCIIFPYTRCKLHCIFQRFSWFTSRAGLQQDALFVDQWIAKYLGYCMCVILCCTI